MAGLSFNEKIDAARERVGDKPLEYIGGKTLLQPFCITNSGSRKIMHAIHRDHVFPLLYGEKAIVETGYEIRFGDRSSSITASDANYVVVAKISKFSFSPNHHYYLILRDTNTNRLEVVERISYRHITEAYGYLYNNEYMDTLQPGSFIPEGTIVQKSVAFDEYNNRKDGVNLTTIYMALDDNMEDSEIISDVAASKMVSPLLKVVRIPINENDIPLNLYGDEKVYKCIPDIGEEINDSVLIALRKEKKEESLYMQSVQRLRKTMISDEKRTLNGRVIDINIYCNNPSNLDGPYNGQFKMYYNELQRMCSEIVATVTPFVSQGYKLSYDLQKLYANAKRVNNKDQYIDKKLFSNLILDVVVLEERPLEAGDKVSNRFGGKGIISDVRPAALMPRYNGKPVDLILNSSTMYNRENPGQIFELSLTHIGCEIVKYIAEGNVSPEDALNMIVKYINFISEDQATYLREYLSNLSDDEKMFFLENVVQSGAIHISCKPFSESMTIGKLEQIYDEFPWIKQNVIEVPIKGSDGSIRFVKARRPVVIGQQYIFRLKQFAEEKFSATSLSATNLRNENTKSKASRNYRDFYSNTPIRFGNMESNNMNHMGSEHVVVNLMIHSVSPQARRLVEQMYTNDPIHIDIKLDSDSKNRGAEIVSTYLKVIGKRMEFRRIPKVKKKPITFNAIRFNRCPGDEKKKAIYFMPTTSFDPETEYIRRKNDMVDLPDPGMGSKAEKPVTDGVRPGIWFDGKDRNENGELV